MTFWVPESGFVENDFMQVVRSVTSDLAESVELLDEFVHPKKNRKSMCFRINYRHMDRNLTNEEVDKMQFRLRDEVSSLLGCELR
jgi:phenylalanyl-tRNA synthetase alpha chain